MQKQADAGSAPDPNDNDQHANSADATEPTGDVSETRASEDPVSQEERPIPAELTGRAAGTGEDLQSLFANASDEHLRDGFRTGNGDDPEADVDPTDDYPEIDR